MFDTLRGYFLIMNPNGSASEPAFCFGYPFCSAQSSINRAAAPLLSPLIRELVRLMDVPWVANQLKLPTGPHSLSTNFRSVMLLSTLYLYWLRSEAGLFRYALGLRFTPAFSSSPENYKSGLIEKGLRVDIGNVNKNLLLNWECLQHLQCNRIYIKTPYFVRICNKQPKSL